MISLQTINEPAPLGLAPLDPAPLAAAPPADPQAWMVIQDVLARACVMRAEADAVELLSDAVAAFGCTAGVFATFLRSDRTMRSCRYLLAGGPDLAALYGATHSAEADPWLLYSRDHLCPKRAHELTDLTSAQRAFTQTARESGFRSALILPSHSPHGRSRAAVLCLGSDDEHFFDDSTLARIRGLAIALALELHIWWHERVKRDLVARARLSPSELDLLRCELEGMASKAIASKLNAPTNTIDSRFYRICKKLGAANRRSAAELLHDHDII